jgi:hypothetical protein
LIIIVVVVLVDITVEILLLRGLGVSSDGRHGGRLRWDGEASRLVLLLVGIVIRSPVGVVVKSRGSLGRSSGGIVRSLLLLLLLHIIIPLLLLLLH